MLSVDSSSFHQWYSNGEQLFGANGPSITTHTPGVYKVEIRTEGGCGAFSPEIDIQVFQNPDSPTIYFNPISNNLLFNAGSGYSWTWYLDGTAIENSNNLTSIHPNTEGNYSVVVENANGCSAISADYLFEFVGIHDPSNSFHFTIYPQPWNSGPLYLDGLIESANFTLTDFSGRVVCTSHLDGDQYQQLQLPNLSAGMYFIKIRTVKNSTTRLFIVR